MFGDSQPRDVGTAGKALVRQGIDMGPPSQSRTTSRKRVWSSNAAKTGAEFLAFSSGRDLGMLRKIVLAIMVTTIARPPELALKAWAHNRE
jgi:hypothetical protein